MRIIKLNLIFKLVYPNANIPIPNDANPVNAIGKINLVLEIKLPKILAPIADPIARAIRTKDAFEDE